jgi:hypothetical protein
VCRGEIGAHGDRDRWKAATIVGPPDVEAPEIRQLAMNLLAELDVI